VRTLPVRWRIEKAIKVPDARLLEAMKKTVATAITQQRMATGRIGDLPGYWSFHDPQKGDRYLIFAREGEENGKSAATAAERPPADAPEARPDGRDASGPVAAKGAKSVEESAALWAGWIQDPEAAYPVSSRSSLVEDEQLIVDGESLGTPAKSTALRDFLDRTGRQASFLLAPYISFLSLAAEGQARSDLLTLVPNGAYDALDESGKSELLRTLHIGLLMQETPSSDAITALTAACLKALARTDLDGDRFAAQRAITTAGLYLPWSLGEQAEIAPAARMAALTPADQRRAAAALRRLVEEQRVPPAAAAALLKASTQLMSAEAP